MSLGFGKNDVTGNTFRRKINIWIRKGKLLKNYGQSFIEEAQCYKIFFDYIAWMVSIIYVL